MTPLYGLSLTCIAALYFAERYELRAKFTCIIQHALKQSAEKRYRIHCVLTAHK